MARITLEDVAKQAGVSFKTVSRVLNNEPSVSEPTSAKVKKAIAQLNYVPNLAARNLSRGNARAIGLVIGWPVLSPYSMAMIDETLKESARYDYSLALFHLINEASAKKIVDACLGRQVDGLILDTVAGDNVELAARLNALHVPCVVVHPNNKSNFPNASFIQIDNTAAAKQAVSYFIALGHRAISFICYESGLHQEGERDEGYRVAFSDAGLIWNEEWLFKGRGGDPRYAFNLGFSGTLHLLSTHKELTAIFAETDEIAMGVVSAIWQMGLKVPDDISVIGFDDVVYASMIAPPLTTIHQPVDEIMRIAVEHLIGMMDGSSCEPIDVVMPTRLVIRETCKPPRREELAL